MGGFVTVLSGASGVCSAWGWGPLRHCCCPHDPRITPVPLAFLGFSVALYIVAAPLALVLAFTLALSALQSAIIFCCCGGGRAMAPFAPLGPTSGVPFWCLCWLPFSSPSLVSVSGVKHSVFLCVLDSCICCTDDVFYYIRARSLYV